MTRKAKVLEMTAADVAPLQEEGAAALPAVQQGGAVATATSDPIFAIIERLAKDPTFDVEKMERLIKMHQSAKADNARAEYDTAMSLAQAEMKAIRTNKANSQTHSRYANYQALDKAIREIYTKHGFAMSFNTGETGRPLEVRVLCTVSHRGGHRQDYKIDVPADGKGPQGADVMTKTHATGSAASYGQRYLTKLIWNLAVGDDDDGNAAAGAKEFTDTVVAHLNTAKLDKAGLEKWRGENQKGLDWLKKKAPDQFERYQTAYSNAAEAAGIKKEEPKRGDNKSKGAAASEGAQSSSGSGHAGAGAPAAGGKSAAGQPASKRVTDVVDQNAAKKKNEPIEFEDFPSTAPFIDFSSKWLGEPDRTPAEAKAWEAFYRAKMAKAKKAAEASEKPITWIIEGIADLLVQYNLILAKEQEQQG